MLDLWHEKNGKKIGLLLLIFLLGMETPIVGEDNSPVSPLKIELSLPEPSALNETAVLHCAVTSIVDAPNTHVEIILPEGFTLEAGNVTWKGDIQENEEIEILITIKSVECGEWMIEAQAQSMTGDDSWIGAREFLYVYVTQQKAIVSSQQINPYYFQNKRKFVIATVVIAATVLVILVLRKTLKEERGNKLED
ncbi:MAG: hypothetical protein PVF58_05810 [Candidatus Methanofastidiosia archaeon]|jgi:hypothetical protein